MFFRAVLKILVYVTLNIPFNHTANTTNGNALGALRSSTTFERFHGRITQLPIYEVDFDSCCGSNALGGTTLQTVLQSMVSNDAKDLINGYRQPTNHDDRLGNLPWAPSSNVVYREYFVSGNNFPSTGYVRLVAVLKYKMLFITPTHYDTWLDNPAAAANANTAAAINPTTAGARNPFYVFTSVGKWNSLFY